jgi:Hg(II)-responsive transcriptional regulator
MATLTISKLAKAAGVELSTIRYYERRGLVTPAARRSSGYREYGGDAVRRVRFIRHAQALGFSLEDIAELLALRIDTRGSCSDVRQRSQRKLDDIAEKIASLTRMRLALEKLVESCSRDGPSSVCPILGAIDEAPMSSTKKPHEGNASSNGERRMKSLQLKIEGMHCDSCADTIQALLARHAGVKSATVSHANGQGQVLYDPSVTDAGQVAKTIEQAGFRVHLQPGAGAR